MLSNIYLHEVLDRWFEQEIKSKLKGRAELIRFADDFVIVCEQRIDAENLLRMVSRRFGDYGLTIHPDKTRIADFRHPFRTGRPAGTFDFLRFTHYWGKTRRGGQAMMSKTSGKKYRASLQRIGQWCKQNRHKPIREQHQMLSQKVRGHYAYYGIRGNFRWLKRFRFAAKCRWHYRLVRRSRERANKQRLRKLLDEHLPLPAARIVHSGSSAQLTMPFS